MLSETQNKEFLKTAHQTAKDHIIEYALLQDETFLSNWHVELLTDRLEQIEKGKLRNLIVTMPPRHGKSYIINELFPSWYLGKHPDRNIITAGNTLRLASSFVTKSGRHYNTNIHKALFQSELNKKKKSASHWETSKGGSHKAFGIMAGIVGSGADVLIIDDPLRNAEQANSKLIRDKIWDEYTLAATSRLTPKGSIIIVTTRYHLDDLVGRIIDNAEETKTLDQWEVINLPAIAEIDESYTLSDNRTVTRTAGNALHPERFDEKELERKKKNMGVAAFLTLYQGTPITAETQTFKKEWFKHVDEKDVKSVEDSQGQKMLRLLAVDAAFSMKDTADNTGFTDMRMDRNGNFYIKTWKKKLPPTELVREILDKQKQFQFDRIFFEGQMYDEGIKAFIEDKAKQEDIIVPVETISHNRATKELRINAIEPYLRDGTTYFINNWCEDLETEMLTFPKGKTDDILDSLALCFSGIREIQRRSSQEKVRAVSMGYSLQP